MGKDVDDQQGRQQDEGVGDPETVGRRFKPDLGHQRVDISAPGRFERRGDPPAHSVGGGHEVGGLDAKKHGGAQHLGS